MISLRGVDQDRLRGAVERAGVAWSWVVAIAQAVACCAVGLAFGLAAVMNLVQPGSVGSWPAWMHAIVALLMGLSGVQAFERVAAREAE